MLPENHHAWSVWAEIFTMGIQTQSGRTFFVFENSKYSRLENQNTEQFVKSLGFLESKDFWSLPTLIGRRYPKIKQNRPTQTVWSLTLKKFSVRSDLKWRRKRVKIVFEKEAKFFCIFSVLSFSPILNYYDLSLMPQATASKNFPFFWDLVFW